jgi:eukaryotic-like serine/threonine-protein kinase
MITICPNYLCSQRLQQDDANSCTNCGTCLTIDGQYKLTKVIRVSPEKINGPEYFWSELFQAIGKTEEELFIKILVITAESLDVPGLAEDIRKIQIRFEREYNVLQKEISGVCRGYEIVDIPIISNTAITGQVVTMRAIIMEKIPGINLDEYIRNHGAIDSQRAIRWLKQLTKTLGKINENQVQHRDIKPSNIMVSGKGANEKLTLIDFGIALNLSNVDTTQLCGTPTYIDPLYITSGQYRDDSDLYSLGQTFIYLLTGQLSQDGWGEDRNIAHPPLNLKLRNAIQKMTAINPQQRFKTADKMLYYIEDRRWPKWLKWLMLILIGLITSLSLYWIFNVPRINYLSTICNIEERNILVNCGDPSLITETLNGENINAKTIKALSSLNINDREKAVEKYAELWKKNPNSKERNCNGELLIYLNNASIYVDKESQNIYTILVAVPNYGKSPEVTKDILSGVAQAQKYFNENNKSKKLYVAVLHELSISDELDNDHPLKNIIQKIAKAADNKFLGVIGHYSSEVTFDVLSKYAENNIFLVSASASRSDIPNDQVTNKQLEYFARTVTNTQYEAFETYS